MRQRSETNKQRNYLFTCTVLKLQSIVTQKKKCFLLSEQTFKAAKVKTFFHDSGKITPNTGISSGITVTGIVSLLTVGWTMIRKIKQSWLLTTLGPMEVRKFKKKKQTANG